MGATFKAAFGSFCYEFYHAYDAYRAAYQAEFGHPPYAEATAEYQWCVRRLRHADSSRRSADR